ncbi:hypothetical protein CF327_g5784 [Tilletia walkeri]|nr:hypothetical protein CF327_g5784 [Tilletia walkeri]
MATSPTSAAITSADNQKIDFTSTTLRFSTTSDEDINAVVALGRKVFFDTFAHTVSADGMQKYLDESYSYDPIKADLTNPNRRCILAEAKGKDGATVLLGYSFLATDTTEDCLNDTPKAIELQRIYTHPLSHGKGVAKQLAEASFDLGRKEGFENIWLGVFPENHRGIGFYKKMGFVKIGTHEFKVGDQIDIDDIMLRSLKE